MSDGSSLQQQIQQLQQDIVRLQEGIASQSHKAGLTEMALGVLHNIGNSITPAKVGTSLLLKRMQESPIKKGLAVALAPLVDVIDQTSLSSEEKIKLKKILQLLPQTLEEEYSMNLAELEKIRMKQAHIESIIAMQMRYSHIVSTATDVDLNRVVKDALLMLDESLAKRAIQVEKKFGTLETVRADESRLLQILINLVKNAYEAMEDLPSVDRILRIHTFLGKATDEGAGTWVCVSVQDQGVGFTQEDQKRFFNFGYTSKAGGSGFGLHASYEYIKEIQGKLDCHSAGRHQGAVFTLKLPLKTQR